METRISASPRAFARIFPVLIAFALVVAAALVAAHPKAAFADSIKEGVPYAIISVSNPNVVIDLDADHPTAGTKAVMAWATGSATQAFTFTKTSDGYYYIRSYYNPSLVLTADSLSMRGAVDVRWGRSTYAQRWRVVELGDGSVYLYSGSTSWMLDTNGQHTEDGAACIIWKHDGNDTQKWTLKELSPATIRGAVSMPDSSDGSTYRISSVSNPSTVVSLDSDANGTGVTMISIDLADGSGLDEFYFDRQIDGSYFIRPKGASDLYLTADSLSLRGGVSAWNAKGSRNRAWAIDVLEDGSLQLLALKDTAWVLDTNGQHTEAGASCVMWTANGTETQKWTIAKPGASPVQPSGDVISGLPDSIDGSTYRLVSVADPTVVLQLDSVMPTAGATATLGTPVGGLAGSHQTFLFDKKLDGSYLIRSKVASTLYLTADLTAGSVTAEQMGSAGEQEWIVEPCGAGVVRVRVVSDSRWVLGITLTKDGKRVIGAVADNGGDSQQWVVERVLS